MTRPSARDFFAFDAQPKRLAELRGKRIFLSGGTGFFGKCLLQSVLFLNHTYELNCGITVLSRNITKFLKAYPEFQGQAALKFVQGDVRSFIFPDEKYDCIIHAATDPGAVMDKERLQEMHSVIVDGTRHMLDFSLHSGAVRFMMASSGAVYGPQPVDVSHVPETYRGSPITAYGQGKLLAEEMCAAAGNKHGFTVLLPRCFAFVGPYLDLDIHYAVGNFIRDCLQGRPITVQGDGTPLRSYLYTADLMEWLWVILLGGIHARPYNVGSDQAVSIKDLAYLVRDVAGSQSPVVIAQTPVPGALPARYVPSIERVKSELQLQVRCPLEMALRHTLEWYRGLA